MKTIHSKIQFPIFIVALISALLFSLNFVPTVYSADANEDDVQKNELNKLGYQASGKAIEDNVQKNKLDKLGYQALETSGNIIYVDVNNTSGDEDGTEQHPYSSIQAGVDNASEGDTIFVIPGVYHELVGVEKSHISLRSNGAILVHTDDSTGSGWDGFSVWDGASNVTITGFILTRYGIDGIDDWADAIFVYSSSGGGIKIINNTLVDNEGDGIVLFGDCTVMNNIIVYNGESGIYYFKGTLSNSYNDVYGNLLGDWDACSPGTGAISKNPLFVDRKHNDFHLQSGSPCIDAGNPDPIYNDSDGSRNDMGAYGGPGVEPGCIKGDIDGNGLALINDAVLLLKHIANPAGNPFDARQKCAGDMDDNSIILINDAVLLLKKIAQAAPGIAFHHYSDTEAKIFISELKTKGGSKVKLTANAVAGASINLKYQNARLLDIKTFGLSAIHQDGNAIQIAWLHLDGDCNIVELEFEGKPILSAADVVVSDSSGNLIPATTVIHPRIDENLLLQNYPNPFNPETWIPYQLKESADVTIAIYNAMGHLIRRINLGKKEAGMYLTKGDAAYWDGLNENGESVAGGVYFYTITAGGNFKATRKMILLK